MSTATLAKLRHLGGGHLGFLLKLLLAAGMLGVLIVSFDGQQVRQLLFETDPWAFAGAVALLTVQSLILTLRWSMIMQALGAAQPALAMLRIMFVSLWFNQSLPSSVGGDAVRVWMLHRKGIGWRLGGKGVLIDRLTALLGVVVLIVLGFPFLLGMTDSAAALLTIAALGAGAIGGTLLLVFFDRLPARLLQNFVMARISSLGQGMRFFLTAYERRGLVMGLAVLIHLFTATAVFVLAGGVGAELSLFYAVLLTPPVILLSAVPITIGSWGVREGAMVAALGIAGVSAPAALVVSILLGLASAVVGLAGGVIWLSSSDRRAFAETHASSSGAAAEAAGAATADEAISTGKRGS